MNIRRIVLLIFSTIAIVLLKLQFEYYNLLFPVLLVLMISILLTGSKTFKINKVILTVLIALNLFCLFTPDKFIYRMINSEEYFWSERDLELSDFKGRPISESNISAIVFPKMIGKVNKVYNYPPGIIFASNEPYKSWIKSSLFDSTNTHQNMLGRLLSHEKNHLSLTEIYTRKAQDSLNNSLFSNPEEKYMIMKYFFNKSDSIQDVFDSETNHGDNIIANKKWDEYTQQKLKN